MSNSTNFSMSSWWLVSHGVRAASQQCTCGWKRPTPKPFGNGTRKRPVVFLNKLLCLARIRMFIMTMSHIYCLDPCRISWTSTRTRSWWTDWSTTRTASVCTTKLVASNKPAPPRPSSLFGLPFNLTSLDLIRKRIPPRGNIILIFQTRRPAGEIIRSGFKARDF